MLNGYIILLIVEKTQQQKRGCCMLDKIIKSKLILLGKNVGWLAERLGISKTALYKKLNGTTRLTLDEARIITDALDLSADEIMEIFFENKVE